MKNLPWKKVGSAIVKGVHIGAQLDPRLAVVDAFIEHTQHAYEGTPGASKKERVEALSDAVLESELAGLTPEEIAAFKAARSSYIDCYVAARNVEARLEASTEQLRAAVAAVKARHAAESAATNG